MKTISLPKEVIKKIPEMEGTIKKLTYIRRIDRVPVGVILMTTDDCVGWSLANPKDRWDKFHGIEKAWLRAVRGRYPLDERIKFFQKESNSSWKNAAKVLYGELSHFTELLDDSKKRNKEKLL